MGGKLKSNQTQTEDGRMVCTFLVNKDLSFQLQGPPGNQVLETVEHGRATRFFELIGWTYTYDPSTDLLVLMERPPLSDVESETYQLLTEHHHVFDDRRWVWETASRDGYPDRLQVRDRKEPTRVLFDYSSAHWVGVSERGTGEFHLVSAERPSGKAITGERSCGSTMIHSGHEFTAEGDSFGRLRERRYRCLGEPKQPLPVGSKERDAERPAVVSSGGWATPTPVDYSMLPRIIDHSGEPEDDEPDMVNHPAHYGGDWLYEPIKVIRAWGVPWALGDAMKYIFRAGKKDPSKRLEDLKKARFYLDDEIAAEERLQAEQDEDEF